MVEFGIINTIRISLKNKEYDVNEKFITMFCGEHFKNNQNFKIIKNIFFDILSEEEVSKISIISLERCIVLTATNDQIIFFRQYKLEKQNSDKIEHISLKEIGPSIDFTFRRCIIENKELHSLENNDSKNYTQNISKARSSKSMGKIYINKQNLNKLEKLPSKRKRILKKKKRHSKNIKT